MGGQLMSAEEYLHSAFACMETAEQLQDSAARQLMFGMAAAWFRLAEYVENNSNLGVGAVDQRAAKRPTERHQFQPPEPET